MELRQNRIGVIIMAIIDFRRKDIIWTASDYSEDIAMTEFPYIEMIEYEQDFSALKAGIDYWFQRAGEASVDLQSTGAYRGLYHGEATKNVYYLPFYMDSHHNISQSWQENTAPLGASVKRLTNAVESVAKAFFPAAGILYPKSYAGANPYALDLTFDLINTISEEGIEKNKRFLELIIQQNLHVRHNVLTITPPCLYEVYVPGVRWSPVSVVSNLVVTNQGTLNRIPKVGGGYYIVPDAWRIQMQLTELIEESRDIYLDAIMGNESGGQMNVRVIETG